MFNDAVWNSHVWTLVNHFRRGCVEQSVGFVRVSVCLGSNF